MATLPFAQAITDMTAGVFALLSNVTVVIGGQSIEAMFQAPGMLANLGGYEVQASKPALVLPTGSVSPHVDDWLAYFEEPANTINLTVVVDAVSYKIVTHEPNGAGISRLLLERIA